MPSDIACPYGCEGAVAIRLTDDILEYEETTMMGPINYRIKVEVPVYWCEVCGDGWTDWRSEDIRAAAMEKHQQKIKI